MEYSADEYYKDFVLDNLRDVELSANSELVELLKNGSRRVTQKALIKKYGKGKGVSLKETIKDPELLSRYRISKATNLHTPLTHEVLSDAEGAPAPNWDDLLNDVTSLPVGNASANNYERAIESLLTAIFYPSLTNPAMQTRIHEGRKRIDITYANAARTGFFGWLGIHYRASQIFVECKNYAADPANPEIDQLSGRFSQNRGQFGVLVCRSLSDKTLLERRCRDTATDHRGFMLILDDEDLKVIVDARAKDSGSMEFPLLRERFLRLIN